MSKTLIYGGYAPSMSVSEFSGFSQQISMNRLPTILLALLDSLSNLSYTWCYSIFKVLRLHAFERDRHIADFHLQWWRIQGSNLRPPACKAGALPAELIPHKTHSAETESP